jgi:hypothetical protein
MKRTITAAITLLIAFPVFSKQMTGFGVYAGAGTNTGAGFSAGAGMGYLLPTEEEGQYVEIGLCVYYSGFSENRTDNALDYVYNYSEKNIIYAIMASMYFNYKPQASGMFEVIGAGAGGANTSWDKNSAEMPVYNDSSSDTGGSLIISPGVGGTFGNGFELRAQLPVFIIFSNGGMKIEPALTLGAGLRL